VPVAGNVLSPLVNEAHLVADANIYVVSIVFEPIPGILLNRHFPSDRSPLTAVSNAHDSTGSWRFDKRMAGGPSPVDVQAAFLAAAVSQAPTASLPLPPLG
jgi:hypothetical protein